MRRHPDFTRGRQQYLPMAPGARRRGGQFTDAGLLAASAEPLGEIIHAVRHAASPQSFDDDPIDALLGAAALAGHGRG
jgi:hypothetical protein